MNITPNHQKMNELLGRNEIEATIIFEQITPKNAEVQQLVAQLFKAEDKAVVIKHIYTDFGTRQAKVVAHVYTSEAAKTAIEPKPKVKKVKAEKTEEKK